MPSILLDNCLHQFLGQPRQGKVHRVFRHALSLDCGALITLLAHTDLVPFSLAIPGEDFSVWPSSGTVSLSRESLNIGGKHITFKDAQVIEQPALTPNYDAAYLQQNIETLEAFIRNHGHLEGIQEIEAWLEQPYVLLGRGKGLTPSGDDYLAGILLADFAWQKLGIALPVAATLQEFLPSRLNSTTRESAHLLGMALQGYFSHGWIRLAGALFSQRPFTIEPWAWRLLHRGATSGTDTAMGLIHGLKIGDACARNSQKRC